MTARVLRCNCTVCETSVCETDGGCSKALTKMKGSVQVTYKCVHWIPHDRPLQCYHDKRMEKSYKVQCCRDKDFCAQDLAIELEYDDTDTSFKNQTNENNYWKIGLIACLLISLSLLIVLLYLFKKYRDKNRSINNRSITRSGSSERLTVDEHRSINRVHIANEIKKESIIGRGKFGMVHKCVWKSQIVAVKVFQSYHRDAWIREEEIYMTPLFRHKNILHFIASDTLANELGLELWLVTSYFKNGSLYEFLNAKSITKVQLLSLAKCIASGLEFLHDEVNGITSSKPGIAHRDLKSSNILVEDDGYNCCIGDFGTAARFYSSTGILDVPTGQICCGTKRYLAPEILNGSINVNNFDSLRQADVYALALIFWEICWQMDHDSYQLPYFDIVNEDPSLEDMYTCVCVNKIRPKFVDSWSECKLLSKFQEIMKECWFENPSARLTARRIVKKLCDNT